MHSPLQQRTFFNTSLPFNQQFQQMGEQLPPRQEFIRENECLPIVGYIPCHKEPKSNEFNIFNCEKNFNDKIAILEQETLKINLEKEQFHQQNRQLSEKLKEAQKSLQQLENSQNLFDEKQLNNNYKYSQLLAKSEQQREKLEKFKQQEEKVKKIKEKLDKKKKKSKQLKEKVKKQKNKKVELSEKNDELKEENKELIKQIKELQEQIKFKLANTDRYQTEFTANRSLLQQELEELQEKYQKVHESKCAYKQKYKANKEELSELREYLQKLKEELLQKEHQFEQNYKNQAELYKAQHSDQMGRLQKDLQRYLEKITEKEELIGQISSNHQKEVCDLKNCILDLEGTIQYYQEHYVLAQCTNNIIPTVQSIIREESIPQEIIQPSVVVTQDIDYPTKKSFFPQTLNQQFVSQVPLPQSYGISQQYQNNQFPSQLQDQNFIRTQRLQ